MNEKALVTKDYIKDTSKTVEELVKEATAEIGEKISIRRFTRYNLGEGIEKRNEDFAAEVAAQTQVKAAEPEPKKEEPKEEKKEEEAPAVKVDAKLVKQLRDSTGAGMMDCKKALAQNNNDIEEATAWLRKKGMASADKKASRIAAEGAVVSYIHAGSRIGVLLELNLRDRLRRPRRQVQGARARPRPCKSPRARRLSTSTRPMPTKRWWSVSAPLKCRRKTSCPSRRTFARRLSPAASTSW